MGRHTQAPDTRPWRSRPRRPLDWARLDRPLLLFAALLVGLIWGGLSWLVGGGSLGTRVWGVLALIAGLSLMALSALYLTRPATLPRPEQPTLRQDFRDLRQWLLDHRPGGSPPPG